MTTLTVHALPKQLEFMRAAERFVLYSGAFGAGKSRALCLKIVQRASKPGARELLMRKTLESLKNTTLHTLLEPEGELPPVLPKGTYTHNKNDKTISIHGGGKIEYMGLANAEDYTKVGSMNVTGIGCDEWIEFTEDDHTMLRGRIRLQVPGVPNQIYGATNPGSPSHFLARLFGLGAEHQSPQPNHRAVQTSTVDNFFLAEEYVADLMTLTGVRYARYVEGQWVGSDGLIYDEWQRNTHVCTRGGPWARVLYAVDEGFTNPFVCLRGCVDGDGRLHIDGEHYRSRMSYGQKVDAVRGMSEDGATCIVDPSAAGLISELRTAGVSAMPADNDVLAGIGRVQDRLVVQGDGMPRLTVDPGCTNLIREFETYEWNSKSTKDVPVKENDHALDALRYMVSHVDHSVGVSVLSGAVGDDSARRMQDGETIHDYYERQRLNPDWGF